MADLLSVTEAAPLFDLAPRTLRGYCEAGRVRGAVRIGNRWAIPRDAEILPPARPHGRPRKAVVE